MKTWDLSKIIGVLILFLFIILNIIKEMTISSDQASEAIIFLTVYNEAIGNLEESARRDRDNQILEDFTDRINRVHSSKIFRRICNPKDTLLTFENGWKHMELIKEVRTFQFSQYVFSKYLPLFNDYVGTSKELSNYIKVQNDQLEADVKKM